MSPGTGVGHTVKAMRLYEQRIRDPQRDSGDYGIGVPDFPASSVAKVGNS
jgi:hypothetical protein